MKHIFLFAFILLLLLSESVDAQVTTSNPNIFATVDYGTGLVSVLGPLDFFDKSYFTCQIGSTYFTNNDVIPNFPANAKHLNDGVTVKIGDTVRTTWANKNGVDIIQDIYPVLFTKSGQIVYKWKVFNHPGGSFVPVQCQYLQDIQITDVNDHQQPNSNDGPIILTRYTYKAAWETFPTTGQPMPWFYIGFLHNIPNSPSYNPGLSAMGYLDYGAPLNLKKPSLMVIGDWYTLASSIFGGQFPGNGVPYSTGSPDNAVLLQFPPTGVAAGSTVEIGRTSYGTGEYEECVGQLFSLIFYPHHFVWDPLPLPGHFSPDSIHVEKYVFDADQNSSSANTKVTLTVNNSVFITDSLGVQNISRSQTQPTSSAGTFIPGGGVGYFDWWIRTKPIPFCTGIVYDTLHFTATCSICPPAFINSLGADECDVPIMIDCGESDVDPPTYSLGRDQRLHIDTIRVADNHLTDIGLKSISWVAEGGTDTSKFTISSPVPSILPCNGDTSYHSILFEQLDSTVAGCFDFTFTDCVGHQTYSTLCFDAKADIFRDSLAPITGIVADKSVAGKWTVTVQDSRIGDKGVDTISVISDSNVTALLGQFTKCSPNYSFVVLVTDTSKPASICFRTLDCAGNRHDTCIIFKPSPLNAVGGSTEFELTLSANRPNPFSRMTTFTYTTATYSNVRLYLFDELGRELTRIIDDPQSAGEHSVDFDGSRFPSGNYIIRLESNGSVLSRKISIER